MELNLKKKTKTNQMGDSLVCYSNFKKKILIFLFSQKQLIAE